MKILYIQSGPGVGGAKISLYHILKNSPSDQISYTVLSNPPNIKYGDTISDYTKNIYYLNLPTWQKFKRKGIIQNIKIPFSNIKRLLSFIPSTIKLARIIKRDKIQIVHTNSAISPVGALASYIANIPHVWHIREPIGNKAEYSLILGDLISRFIINLTSKAIICNSNFTAAFFNNKSNNLYVIQNGLEIKNFQSRESKRNGNQLRQKLTGNSESLSIGIVGNLAPLKNHNIFLMAAKQINNLYPNCFFCIFGSLTKDRIHGNSYAELLLKTAKKIGIDDKVIWVDFINDIPSIFHSIDILIHPASDEGSGRVVMEAMSSGKPVIGINSGGVKELIKDGINGYLVPIGNISEIVDRVQFLIENSSERKLIEDQAVQYSKENFSSKQTMDSIISVYKKLLH